jgi:hypothetical protein
MSGLKVYTRRSTKTTKIKLTIMENNQKYKAYERVRVSGVTNMFDVRTVGLLSGLSREDILDVMHNYSEYRTLYEVNK